MSSLGGNLVAGIPAVGTVLTTIADVGGLFHTSSAGPNADAANAIAPEVAKGNLAAVAAASTRSGITVVASAAPWKALMATVPAPVVAAMEAKFPGNQWATFGAVDPSQVLPIVQRLAVYVNPLTGQAVGVQTGPGSGSGQSPSSQEAGVLGSFGGVSFSSILLLAGVGIIFYFLAKHSKGA